MGFKSLMLFQAIAFIIIGFLIISPGELSTEYQKLSSTGLNIIELYSDDSISNQNFEKFLKISALFMISFAIIELIFLASTSLFLFTIGKISLKRQ
jgi:hypothetical protein